MTRVTAILILLAANDLVRNGHLFLSLMADGGIYEFEPMPRSKR